MSRSRYFHDKQAEDDLSLGICDVKQEFAEAGPWQSLLTDSASGGPQHCYDADDWGRCGLKSESYEVSDDYSFPAPKRQFVLRSRYKGRVKSRVYDNLEISIPGSREADHPSWTKSRRSHTPNELMECPFSETESGFEEGMLDGESTFSGSVSASNITISPCQDDEFEPLSEVPGSSGFDDVVASSESYEEAEGPPLTEGDIKIEKACVEIRNAYGSATTPDWRLSGPLDFSDAFYKRAYVGLYVAANLTVITKKLHDFWLQSPAFRSWLKNCTTMNVASIGGGPGTDILGLSLFLQQHDLPNSIEGTIFDLYNWESIFKYLAKFVDDQRISQYISTVSFNLYHGIPKRMRYMLHVADLVTMIKFISVFPPRDRSAKAIVVNELMEAMKPGAVLFVVDSAGGGAFDFVCEMAEGCGMQRIAVKRHENIQTCPKLVEHLKLSRRCCANCNPQRYTKVSAVLYQKVC